MTGLNPSVTWPRLVFLRACRAWCPAHYKAQTEYLWYKCQSVSLNILAHDDADTDGLRNVKTEFINSIFTGLQYIKM